MQYERNLLFVEELSSKITTLADSQNTTRWVYLKSINNLYKISEKFLCWPMSVFCRDLSLFVKRTVSRYCIYYEIQKK